MATIVLIFFIAVGLAALLGWTTDTRDSADWAPSEDLAPTRRQVSNL